jgi:hypothetical protein
MQGWPEPYIYVYTIYTVYLVISKPKVPYVHHIYVSGQPLWNEIHKSSFMTSLMIYVAYSA